MWSSRVIVRRSLRISVSMTHVVLQEQCSDCRIDGPCLNVGAFAQVLLKAVNNCTHTVVGKSSKEYFLTAVEDMGLDRESVVMIGDDLIADVGRAQNLGIRRVQAGLGEPQFC
ncbi:hypothetical protein L596_024631 [Steinernema carpocapsae]|uniref:Uncharacterized protein n=1 Tax=Steinernema carpocapsae TaxID=34508 RepID=A0A4U5M5C4_STECR|nr:hypothetical protein L596_024631 [Steinernema carpocapsae]